MPDNPASRFRSEKDYQNRKTKLSVIPVFIKKWQYLSTTWPPRVALGPFWQAEFKGSSMIPTKTADLSVANVSVGPRVTQTGPNQDTGLPTAIKILRPRKRTNMVQSMDSSYLMEMNSSTLQQFVSTKDGALSVIEWLRGGVKSRLHYRQIRPYVAALARCGVYQVYCLPAELTIHRARYLKDKKWPESAAELGPPPVHKTTDFGRCNQPNQPLCYCSLYEDTALTEIDAELAAQYVVATFTLPKCIRLISVGDFDYYRRTGNTSIGNANPASVKAYKEILAQEDWIIPAVIDGFLADEFIKRTQSHTDYKITSAFSDVLLNGELDPNQPIDAIIYPSVAFRQGLNFAIRPEAFASKLKLVEAETKIIEITDVAGYGIFNYRILATLKPVNFQELLNWDAA